MKPIEFVKQARKQVVEENNSLYRDLFRQTDPTSATDEYWKKASAFFHGLDPDSKEVFFEIIRQIGVDTTSNILGILDGVCWLENQEDEFVLTVENNPEVINGDLQSLFLEQEEENY